MLRHGAATRVAAVVVVVFRDGERCSARVMISELVGDAQEVVNMIIRFAALVVRAQRASRVSSRTAASQ